jgi:sterol desaturase/sphingolipid hydroxylase (fatty acid hydroxylase superfamily)
MKLTKSLYFSDFVAAPLVLIVLSALALAHVDSGLVPFLLWVLAFAAGCAAWTLVEYAMHRWIYHRVSVFEKFHDAHHGSS